MRDIRHFPVVRFTAAFMAGIAVQKFVLLPLTTLWVSALFIFLLALLIRFQKIRVPVIVRELLAFPLAISVGMLCFEMNHSEIRNHPLSVSARGPALCYGEIESIELKKSDRFTFTVIANALAVSGKCISAPAKLLCTVRAMHNDEWKSVYLRLQPGMKVRMEGVYSRGKSSRNPGEFDYAEYLTSLGILGTLTIDNPAKLRIINPSVSTIGSFRHRLRNILADKADKILSPDAGGLFKGLVLGDRSDISDEMREAFINAGVAHVLAVSGLNVTYIMLICLLLLGRLPLQVRYIGSGAGIFFFWFLVGSSPPIARASVMGALIICTVFLNRKANSLNILFLTALLVLLIAPSDLFSASFQLSFTGVFALLVVYPPLKQLLDEAGLKRGIIRNVLMAVLLTVAAQLGILPVTNYYFGKLSLTSFFSNLIVVPAVSFFMGAGLLTLAVHAIIPSLGTLLADGCNALSWIIFSVVRLTGMENYSYVPVNGFTYPFILLYYFVLGILLFALNNFGSVKSKIWAMFLCTILIAIVHFAAFRPAADTGKVTLLSIDVGQGDATLVILPDRTTLLVDAGNAYKHFDNGARVIIPLLKRFGISKIDYGIISHFDTDHALGFSGLLKHQAVSTFIIPPCSSAKDSLLSTYARQNGAYILEWKDTVWHLPEARLYPLQNREAFENPRLKGNDKSVCFILQFGKSRLLFTGDAQKAREQSLLESIPRLLRADILKVAHHGSKYGTTSEFLRCVTPRLAVISAGKKNIYGHPHSETLKRLADAGITVLRTDDAGLIQLSMDGSDVIQKEWR